MKKTLYLADERLAPSLAKEFIGFLTFTYYNLKVNFDTNFLSSGNHTRPARFNIFIKTSKLQLFFIMKRGHTHIFLIVIFSFLFCPEAISQVTIGSRLNPNKGALLDLKEQNSQGGITANKGLGLPRVDLEEIDQLFPMFGNVGNVNAEYIADKSGLDRMHLGMVVYNLTLDLEKGLCPGVYAWSEIGAQYTWVRLPEPCAAPLKIENSPNSYFVKPGEAIEIPLGKPYIVAEGRSDLQNISIESKAYVELLWQDTQSLISNVELIGENKGPYSTMKVQTNSAASGNALVAVRMGPTGSQSDPIVWSWHIWVTDYDPNSGGTTYAHNNGEDDFVFMDRNLGATTVATNDVKSMGLTYQWGRKDPFSADTHFAGDGIFRTLYDANNAPLNETNELDATAPAATGIKHVEIAESKNLANSIANPMVFYYGPVNSNRINPADWYTSDATGASGDDNLWSKNENDKSLFDPCPKGWRVPSSSASKSPWARFENIESGWGGWGEGGVSPATPLNTGLSFTGVSGASDLGFYPYGLHRNGSAYESACPVVGSSPFLVAGGLAYDCYGDDRARSAMYWIADPISGKAQAKAEYFNYNDSGLMDGPSVKLQELPRSVGAYVRCVADSNPNPTH